jgi:hypothetical protein
VDSATFCCAGALIASCKIACNVLSGWHGCFEQSTNARHLTYDGRKNLNEKFEPAASTS